MKRKALVVDDDHTMTRTLSDVLSMKGWDVTIANDGKEAVSKAAASTFDVVLMDVKMPVMNGVEAFKAMKASNPNVRVVLMTAYAAEELLNEAEREGVARILSKPVNFAELLPLLASARSRKKPVLLVDHDAQFLRTLSESLQLRGYDAVVAATLDEAEHLLRREQPQAVLLHMHLGAHSAREAIVAIHELSPTVALILYSGRPGGADEIGQLLPPDVVHAYFQKPFGLDEVAGALDAISR